VVEILIAIDGVGLESQDNDGRIPLLLAAGQGHEPVVKLLLLTNGGAEPDSKDKYGRMPLLFAAEKGSVAVVCLLLANGVAPDSGGRTPLSLAAGNWNTEVVNMLLDTNGVDPASEDTSVQTPLLWAEAMERVWFWKRNPVANLLKDAIAKHEALRKSSVIPWPLFSLVILLISVFVFKSNSCYISLRGWEIGEC
jgi:ankyrin repeat protein